MRVPYGPGYRVYFVQRGAELIVLLCGGDKSTQGADIAEAKGLAKELRDMTKIETTAFDSADYLNSAEAVAAYLDAYLEDSTQDELREALATVARSHGVSDLARRSGVSRPGIYKALGQDGNPSFETIQAILGAMGLRLKVVPAEQEHESA
jgi:probable addiction module antidote protein